MNKFFRTCVISLENHACVYALCLWLQICVWNPSLIATAVIGLIPLFSRHVIVSCVWLEFTTYCVLLPHSTESLSTAIIPSKTSVVIPAMFHRSVAIYSEAHCLSMLASTKMIACECLCVFVCECPHCYSFLCLTKPLVISVDEYQRKELSRQVCLSPVLFHNEVWVACLRVCVCVVK